MVGWAGDFDPVGAGLPAGGAAGDGAAGDGEGLADALGDADTDGDGGTDALGGAEAVGDCCIWPVSAGAVDAVTTGAAVAVGGAERDPPAAAGADADDPQALSRTALTAVMAAVVRGFRKGILRRRLRG